VHARGFRDESFAGLPLSTLAEIAGLSRPSVYNVQDVYEELLLEPLRLRPDIGYAIGVELGPRNALVAIADIHGQLFEHREEFERYFKLLRPPEEYLDWAATKIDELVRQADVEPHEVMGVGISQVAPINTSSGHAHPSGLANKAWRDVNVGDQLARRLVALRRDWEGVQTGPSDNETNLSALAEHTFGSAQDVDDVLYVNWSSHVGFGLILAGRPYRGSRGYAGELGHLLIDEDRGNRKRRKVAAPCRRCGKVGCLEMRIGAAGLAEEFGANEEDLIRAADYVLDRVNVTGVGYEANERLRLDAAARLLGQSVASIVDTLDPAALILGGSLGGRIHDDTALLRAFREGLEERMMGFAQEIEIRQPKLQTSAVQGATLRVLSERLIEWAQQKVAATAVTESEATRDPDTATPGIDA
jgi:predicted NBD/HSP70 family sugar kinase